MIYIILTAAIFILDGIIKNRIEKTRKLGEKQNICHDRLILTKYYNDGAALNFLAKKPKVMKGIHTVLMAVISGIYGKMIWDLEAGKTAVKGKKGVLVALAMIVGGGMSNLIDRYQKKHVVDYISFNVKNRKLRGIVYNVSDFFVFAGSILLVLLGIKDE